MSLYNLIVPLGLLTYSLAVATLVGGLLRVKLQFHKIAAYATIVLATLHAALVIYAKFF